MAGGVITPKGNFGYAVPSVSRVGKLDFEKSGLAPAAQGAAALSGDLKGIGLSEKQDEDRTIATETLTSAEMDWQAKLSNDLLSRKGKNALASEDQPDVVTEGLRVRDDVMRDHLDKLQNGTQRMAFQEAWLSRDRFAVEKLRNHLTAETEQYKDNTDSATIAVEQQKIMSTDFREAEARENSINSIDSVIQITAKRKGWGEKEIAIARIKSISPSLETVISTTAQTNQPAAIAMLKEYDDRGLLDRSKLEGLVKTIKSEGDATAAQALSAAAFATAPKDAPLDVVVKYIQDNSSGDVEEKAIGVAERQWRINENSRLARNKQLGESMIDSIRRTNYSSMSADQIEAERRDLYRNSESLDASDQDAIAKVFDAQTSGIRIATQFDTYQQYMKDPRKLDGVSVPVLTSQLGSGTELDHVLEVKRARDLGEISGLSEFDKETDDMIKQMGLDDEKAGIYRSQVRADLLARQQNGSVNAADRAEVLRGRMITEHWYGDSLTDDAAIIEEARGENPNLVGLATWNATAGGTREANVVDVAANIRAIQNKVRRAALAGDTDEVARLTAQINAGGNSVRRTMMKRSDAYESLISGKDLQAQDQAAAARAALAEKRAKEKAAREARVKEIGASLDKLRAGASIEELMKEAGISSLSPPVEINPPKPRVDPVERLKSGRPKRHAVKPTTDSPNTIFVKPKPGFVAPSER